MSPAIIEILVLAGIAIFLVLRLKNVLGTREGFEKPPLQDAADRKSTRLNSSHSQQSRMPSSA